MCASCKDPGLSGYPTWYFHHVDTYWDRGPRADKTWMDTRRAGTGCSHGHGYSHGRERHTHKESPRGMTGAATLVQPAP